MQTIKTLGLGIVAATTIIAINGTATVLASTQYIALCAVLQLTCFLKNQYPAGTVLKGKLKSGTKAIFTGSLKVECEESQIGLKTKGDPLGELLLVEVVEFIFAKCSTCPKINALTGAFGEGHLKNLGNLIAELVLLDPIIHFEACFGFAKCTASAGTVNLKVDTSVSPPVVQAVSEKLSMSGFGCGTEVAFNAEYALTSPTPLFIES